MHGTRFSFLMAGFLTYDFNSKWKYFILCLANNCNTPPQARWIFITYDATNQIYYHIYAHLQIRSNWTYPDILTLESDKIWMNRHSPIIDTLSKIPALKTMQCRDSQCKALVIIKNAENQPTRFALRFSMLPLLYKMPEY